MMPYGLPRRPSLQDRSYGSCIQLPPSATIPSLLGPPRIQPERRVIEYPSIRHQYHGRPSQSDRNRLDPPPVQFSSTRDQDGRPPQEGVSEFSYPARDHRTHINIGGNVNQIQHHGEGGVYFLHRAAAVDAFHDSAERFPQPRCHPETRTEMLADLCKWSSDTDSDRAVYWLHGPAGAGKSAMAQSFCAKLEAQNRLAASFFFKRGHPSRGNGNRLFTTVASQLALCQPELKTTISRIVEDDPSVIHRALSVQLQKLIIEPCRQTFVGRILVIVIDGLDECEGKEIQREILRSIGTAVRQGPLPLRFFVASRPEPHIREVFPNAFHGVYSAMNINQSFDDVRKYLLDEFARIHREHHETMAAIPFPWPAPQVVDGLVSKSSGYFIYVSTVIKFIDDKDFRPTERLKAIMGTNEADDDSPFAALDLLYTQILSQIPARQQLLRILTVLTAKLDLSIGHIEQLLGLEPGDVRLILRGMQSLVGAADPFPDDIVLRNPLGNPDDWSSGSRIYVHHASFYDFLQDPRRAGIFHTDCDSCKTDLSRCILQTLSDESTTTKAAHLVWYLDTDTAMKHMISSKPSSGLISLLRSFNPVWLFRHHSCREIIDSVLNWLKKSQPFPEDLIQVWREYRFMQYFASVAACIAPTQVNQVDQNRSYQVLSQASPLLLRILQAGTSINPYMPLLFQIHFFLDISWNELRTAICSLRSFMDSEIVILFIVAKKSATIAANFNSLVLDFTRGALRFVQKVLRAEFPRWIMIYTNWSWYLQRCPPSLQLLEDVQLLAILHPDFKASDYQTIIRWLKTFPDPRPVDLIRDFERLRGRPPY
ncbi:NACHT domain-containing protein [Mycena sanguinolenta]|uniref:NACHT domain-containing protein n=1 Tax=Mycena sanguinolenta TaxID=230812 RepID=A0A8H6WXW1_9AGAR|nr:NACHT domain-containing protein [Mycena sanguinolenta]